MYEKNHSLFLFLDFIIFQRHWFWVIFQLHPSNMIQISWSGWPVALYWKARMPGRSRPSPWPSPCTGGFPNSLMGGWVTWDMHGSFHCRWEECPLSSLCTISLSFTGIVNIYYCSEASEPSYSLCFCWSYVHKSCETAGSVNRHCDEFSLLA